jgi:hypothetical protein
MALTAGRPITFTQTLVWGGALLSLSPDAVITAQLCAADGETTISRLVPVLFTEPGSDWSVGKIVIQLLDTDTTGMLAPNAVLNISVLDLGVTRNWREVLPVDTIPPEHSALFVRYPSVARFRAERMGFIRRYFDDEISDEYIWETLKAAEADAAHALRVLLVPTTVFASEGPTEADLVELNGAPWVVEPAYDFEPNNWKGDAWGWITTRQMPIISIDAVEFTWPGNANPVFAIPKTWIRADRKYGHVQFVPYQSIASTMSLSMYMMTTMGGGRTMPQMIQMRYVAGLENVARDYPDLVSLVYRMATIRMLTDAVLPASGSISAAGLSQSFAAPDFDKLQAAVDVALNRLRDKIHGIRVAFV